MKKKSFIRCLLLMLCAGLAICTCLVSCTPKEDEPKEESPDDSKLAVEEAFRYRFSDPQNPGVIFRLQGGFFDGTNFYFAFISHDAPTEFAYIVVLDKDGKEVKRSQSLEIGHSNSLSLRNDGTILVSVGNSQTYHIVDKETLTVLETKTVSPEADRGFLSIDYCPATDSYVMLGEGWGVKLYHMNNSLEVGQGYDMAVEENSAGQNFFCTEDFLYSVRYKAIDGMYHNYLYIHCWNGDLEDMYYLTVPGEFEAQSVSVDGDMVYIPCGNYNSECILYTATLP